MKIEHRSPMHLDRQNAQLGTKHGVHCRLTMGLMISTTCLYSNFDLINHIYKKKTGVRNISNKPEFRRATTTLLAAQKLFGFTRNKKGQRTTSTYTSQLRN